MNIIQILLGEFYQKLDLLDHLVERDASFSEAPNKIKVAIGMRRVGKTYFLYQHIKKLMKQGVDKKRILYINFDDKRLLPLNAQKLAELVDAFYALYPENHDQKCFLFLDGIENVEEWPLVIRRLHDSINAEIFLTGSSAKLLSKEIATNLRGRSLALELWPYSFQEFLRAKGIAFEGDLFDKKKKDVLKQTFFEYMSIGGFPEVTQYVPDERNQTLQDYLDIVIYRDIIERHTIRNPSIIKYMILSMIHNVGNAFSINKFYQDLKSQGYVTSKDFLYDYAEHIEDAYTAFLVGLHDRSLRKIQVNPKKTYAVDSGLIRSVMLNDNPNFGKIFENIVYLDLRRRGCKISYYLTSHRNEVDFVIETPQGEKKCLQVVLDFEYEHTLERKLRALEEAKKELKIEGHIITLDSYLEKGLGF